MFAQYALIKEFIPQYLQGGLDGNDLALAYLDFQSSIEHLSALESKKLANLEDGVEYLKSVRVQEYKNRMFEYPDTKTSFITHYDMFAGFSKNDESLSNRSESLLHNRAFPKGDISCDNMVINASIHSSDNFLTVDSRPA